MSNNKVPGTIPRVLYKVDFAACGYEGKSRMATNVLEEANIVSSKVLESDYHAPVLDIDIPATLVPSSTPGHSHLYLDVECSWERYKELLTALAQCNIIEPGYANASFGRGFTAVRLPWIKKGEIGGQK